jgi:protein-histidine pros-kinase
MKLLLKFNLIFLLAFVIGLAASMVVAQQMLKDAATKQVLDQGRMLMDEANAVSSYTAQQIKPLLEAQLRQRFLPQSVPAYAAAEVLQALKQSHPDYSFKSAMLNPTNPRDRAVAWEEDVIAHFQARPEAKEFVGQRDTPHGPALYVARPIRIDNPACLACHSTPAAAPPTLVARYGPSNGFGWKLGETLGAQIATVPMAVPLAQARQALWVVLGLQTAVFLLIGAVLNLMLWLLVVKPVSQLSALADRVSLGELDAAPTGIRSRDEIGTLAASFDRMRKSLAHAMKLLDPDTR